MGPPSTMCASCLRAARTSITRTSLNARPLRSQPSRAFSIAAAATTHQPLYLDFLAPSALRISLGGFRASTLNNSIPGHMRLSARRTIASSATRSAEPVDLPPARAISNPRNDEAGNPMLISLTPRATHRLSSIAEKDANPNLALRITVESGGCHGFQYLMSLDDLSRNPATEEDTLFEGDKGAKVVIDESSLELLKGSTVDYTMELIGSQFKVTGIPGATSSCGCGTSFDIKFD